jgi:GNAT superfamily N-acetyltransferase
MTRLSFKPVTASTWKDFEALFEAKGAPSYCWCMAWRDFEGRQGSTNAQRKKAMHDRVKQRVPVGLLAYEAGKPIGWCSVAPRDTLRKMSPHQDAEEEGVWSIACFYVPRERRGEGLSEKLLEAAIKLAFKRGAKAIEGYPVAKGSPSYRYMGFLPLFRNAGFRETGRAGSRRHVVRRSVVGKAKR